MRNGGVVTAHGDGHTRLLELEDWVWCAAGNDTGVVWEQQILGDRNTGALQESTIGR